MYSSEHILKTRSPKYEGRPLSDSPISEDTTQIMLIFSFSGTVQCGRCHDVATFNHIPIGHFVGHLAYSLHTPGIFLHYTFHGFVAIIVAVSQN